MFLFYFFFFEVSVQLFQRHIPSHKYKYDHTMRLNYYKQPFGFGLQTAFIDHLKTALIKLILFFALALFYTNIKNDVIIGTQ